MKNLTIFFRGEQVNNVSFIILSIKNYGNRDIRREDFDDDLVVDFGDANVLSAKLYSPQDPNGESNYKREENKVYIGPALLNRGDELHVAAFLSHLGPFSPEIKSRIVGIKKIYRFDEIPANKIGMKLGAFLFDGEVMGAVIVLLGAFLSFSNDLFNEPSFNSITEYFFGPEFQITTNMVGATAVLIGLLLMWMGRQVSGK